MKTHTLLSSLLLIHLAQANASDTLTLQQVLQQVSDQFQPLQTTRL